MRLAVLGTGPFAVPMFQSLFDSPHQVLGLVTRPTPRRGAREKLPPNPMRDEAERRGLPVFAPESINSDEGRAVIQSLAPELLVVCDYGQILSADVLGLVPLGGINLHASLLPKYRGAAPIHWALLNGDYETGVTVIHMTPRLDAGPILAVRHTPIASKETQPELEARLAALGVGAVWEAIELLARWDRISSLGTPQVASHATSALRLRKEHGAIDWTRTAEQIHNQVRALKPWPGTYTYWHRPGEEPLRLAIDRVSAGRLGATAGLPSSADAGAPATPPGHLPADPFEHGPGHAVVCDGKQLVIATGQGGLSILAIQPAGKKVLPIDQFLRGYHVRLGDRFGPATLEDEK
ncbi:MAG: methionyl-tRNA formyltransferase [Planctomycetaceae bacterium]|nr:methionyl-tRNA formyltransferase [Planctomycetaceae bacterium]